MGLLEKKVQKKKRRSDIQKALLMSVGAAGFISMAIVTPNALQALSKLGVIDMRNPRRKELVNRSRDRLISLGFLKRDAKGFVHLTQKGRYKLQLLVASDNRTPEKSRRWDEKWRILIFDIPEYRRPLRDKVRRTLSSIGFKRLQDSVWIFPYDCEDLVTLLKADFKVGKSLIYLIVEAIENDSQLRKEFGLPLS